MSVGPAIHLVISDIDGTLVRHDKSLSDAVVAAARRLQDAGAIFSLISARPPSGIVWIAEKLGLTAPIGAFNGGTLCRPDGTIVSASHLDPDVARRTLALLDKPGITPWLFAGGRWYAQTTENDYVPRERKAAGIEPDIRRDFGDLLAAVDKIVGVGGDHDALAALDTAIAAEFAGRATVARSQPYYLDVTAPAGNKGDGVAALAAAIGVPLAEVAVLGDQYNDLPMFARAALSVAMGQAPDKVRAAATHVTRSNDEDGVAAAIDDILMPLVRGTRPR